MKKFTQVAVAAGLAVALSSSAFAGGYSRAEMPADHCGVHGLGVSVLSTFGGVTAIDNLDSGHGLLDWGKDLYVCVDYIYQQLEAGVVMSGTHTEASGSTASSTQFDIGGRLGYRMPLFHCLYGSVGVNGLYGAGDQPAGSVNPYQVGAYMGLSYEPTEHLSVFTRVNAIQYNRSTADRKFWNFFNNAEFGVAYYFGDLA